MTRHRRTRFPHWAKNLSGVVLVGIVILFVLLSGNIFQKKYRQRYAVDSMKQADVSEQTDVHNDKGKNVRKGKSVTKLHLGGDTYVTAHEIKSYLIIGTDASGNQEAEGEEYRGSMADFLLLAVIDHTDKSYGYLQLNRDTMTEIPLRQTDGSRNASAVLQLCTAHWYGENQEASCQNTVDAVTKLLGKVPVEGYYALDMKAIPKLNQMIGGVEVEIEDDFSESDSTLVQGTKVLLNDEQAYHYIHDRLNVGDGENISRMRRQKSYMEAAGQKIRSLQKMDQKFILRMLKGLESDSVTNLNFNEFAGVLQRIGNYTSTGIHTIEGTTKLGQALGDGMEHTEFYCDDDSLKEQVIQLYHLEKT